MHFYFKKDLSKVFLKHFYNFFEAETYVGVIQMF
jgi:hypothetical protein